MLNLNATNQSEPEINWGHVHNACESNLLIDGQIDRARHVAII